jgi:hypothetical protein
MRLFLLIPAIAVCQVFAQTFSPIGGGAAVGLSSPLRAPAPDHATPRGQHPEPIPASIHRPDYSEPAFRLAAICFYPISGLRGTNEGAITSHATPSCVSCQYRT